MLDMSKASKFEFGQFLKCTVKWSVPAGYEVWIDNDRTLPGMVPTGNLLAAGRTLRVRFAKIKDDSLQLIYMDDRNIVDESKAPPKPGGFVRWEEHLDQIT